MNKNPPSDLFPERLKEARRIRQMDQAELAAKAEMPPTSISHFEGGARKPSFDTLRRLAQALDVTTDYLLGRVDTPTIGQAPEPLYRDMQKLTAKDRELAQDFIALLASKRNVKDEKK